MAGFFCLCVHFVSALFFYYNTSQPFSTHIFHSFIDGRRVWMSGWMAVQRSEMQCSVWDFSFRLKSLNQSNERSIDCNNIIKIDEKEMKRDYNRNKCCFCISAKANGQSVIESKCFGLWKQQLKLISNKCRNYTVPLHQFRP